MSFRQRLRLLSAALNPSGSFDVPINVSLSESSDEDMMQQHFARFSKDPLELYFFRLDPMLRRCVTILAGYVTTVAGFDTVLEPPTQLSEDKLEIFRTQYAHVKDYADKVNKRVNMDARLFIAQILLCLYGKAAFEIVEDKIDGPLRLRVIPVANSNVKGLQPVVKNGVVQRFELKTENKSVKYQPGEVLYFKNTDLADDWQGESDLDALIPTCIIRLSLLCQTPKILKRLYSPYVIACVDSSNTPDRQLEALEKKMKKLADGLHTGSNIVVNSKVDPKVMQLNINLSDLISFDDKTDGKIISHFGIPRFLVNEPNVNRATAETEFTAFVEGTVSLRQRYLKRELEAAWYDRLARQALKLDSEAPLPVKVKHVWRDTDMGNVKEKVEAAVALFGNSMGIFGESPELALKTTGLLTVDVEKWLNDQKHLLEKVDKGAVV